MDYIINWWSNLSEGWQIAFVFSLAIPSLTILRFVVKANRDFFILLDEFQQKLPPQHKRAREDLEVIPYMTFIDTSSMKMNLTTQEIDIFLKKLETFNYSRILFKRKKIISYSRNIQRLIRTSAWEKFGIAIIQKLLEDESYHSSKPYLFGKRIGKIIRF